MSEGKNSNVKKASIPMVIIGVLLCFAAAIFGGGNDSDKPKTTSKQTTTRQAQTEEVTENKENYYYFRNDKSLKDHFKKHGADTYCKTAEEYLEKANAVINNPKALYKTEAEDGDSVYYIEKTDEIVFVSTDGYIRTYFICSGKAYFDKQ